MLRALTGLLAVLLVAWASPALAQGCGPSNPNCIVPTVQPFTTSDNRAASTAFVQGAAIGGNPVGWVRFSQDTSQNWHCIDPFGTPISTGGTTTQGLQECLNYAHNNGLNFHAYGGSPVPSGAQTWGIVNATSTVTIPTGIYASYEFDAITLLIAPTTGSNDGLVIDSQFGSNISLKGVLAYTGSGNAVRFRPTTSLAGGALGPIILGSTFYFQVITNLNATTPTLVRLSPGTTADIQENRFTFQWLEGGDFNTGTATANILLAVDTNTSPPTGVFDNKFYVGLANKCLVTCVLVGTTTASPPTISENSFEIDAIFPGAAAADAITVWSQLGDYYHVATMDCGSGGLRHGLTLGSPANQHQEFFILGTINCLSAANQILATGSTDNFIALGNKFWGPLGFFNTSSLITFNGVAEADFGVTTPNVWTFDSAVSLAAGGTLFGGAVQLFSVPLAPSGNQQTSLGASATLGSVLIGQGSTNDNTVQNKSSANVCQNPTGTTTWNCTTLQQNGTGVATVGAGAALASATPGNPTGTASTAAFVMMGLGSTCTITPTSSGRVRFHLQGNIANNTASDSGQVQLATGTGSAPANAAAATGTVRGNPIKGVVIATANAPGSFALDAVATGLTLSTAVWFDLQAEAITGGTFTPSSITCDANEF